MNSALILALGLGMRHGTDPDHLTAIDGLSRIRPSAANGFLFALGHGAVVTMLAVGVGEMISDRAAFLGPWVLIFIGCINLWRVFRPAKMPNISRRPIIGQPFLLGMLLAAGFETASQFAALILTNRLNPWLVGGAFTAGMVIVDGLDGYLAASTQRLAMAGSSNAAGASRLLGMLVVLFSFGLGAAELLNFDIDRIALPTGLGLFAMVVAIRVWARKQIQMPAADICAQAANSFVALTIVALCTIAFSGCASTEHPPASTNLKMPMPGATTRSTFDQAMMQSMADMNNNMMAAPMTGDPDHDFVVMMIPHHQGAVEMAKPYLLYGKDPTLRRLAQEIIVSQKQEIDVMQLRLAALPTASASTVPQVHQSATYIPFSSHDRVYTADQTSNTVSVIDPGMNKLLGVIRLGDPVPGALSPLYRGQLLVHGMGFSPDHRTIAVVSIGSNSVTFIDTATNAVKGIVYIGRSPHEAFFTPDGRELWATVRGENYVSVIDPVQMKEIRRVQTANGPGMVLFRPDGKYAFIPSSFTPELDVVDMQSDKIVARVPQASPFSPNLAVSRDGTEVWFTLKDSGKTQVMSGEPPFNILATLDTGPITNHVTLVDSEDGKFAYVSVGEENVVKVFRRGSKPELIASIPTGDLPHGLWGSDDGKRVYVGLENGDAVAAIDTHTNTVLATIPVGQQPQALVYVPGAVPSSDGTSNLLPLGDAGNASHLTMSAPEGVELPAHATVSVNELGTLDLLEAAVSGLKPGHAYTLSLVASRNAPFGQKEALVSFKTNVAGAQVVQAIAPLREVLSVNDDADAEKHAQRFLLVTDVETGTADLIQTNNPLAR